MNYEDWINFCSLLLPPVEHFMSCDLPLSTRSARLITPAWFGSTEPNTLEKLLSCRIPIDLESKLLSNLQVTFQGQGKISLWCGIELPLDGILPLCRDLLKPDQKPFVQIDLPWLDPLTQPLPDRVLLEWDSLYLSEEQLAKIRSTKIRVQPRVLYSAGKFFPIQESNFIKLSIDS
jgi:hypothetical protein